MKWISTAIGAVIAITTIGILATSVYSMTKETTIIDDVETSITILEGDVIDMDDYNNLYMLLGDVSNYSISGYYNSVSTVFNIYSFNSTSLTVRIPSRTDFDLYIDNLGTVYNYGNGTDDAEVGDVITFIVTNAEVTRPPLLTGISATLILLAPLILTGTVLTYYYNHINNKRKEL